MLLSTNLKFFAILEYCYDNYASNAYVKPYIEDFSAVQDVTPRIQFSIFVTPTLAFSGDAICYFLRGWVFFLFCILFMSCISSSHHSHCIGIVFIKLAFARSCRFFLVPVDPSTLYSNPSRASETSPGPDPGCHDQWVRIISKYL